MSRDIQRDSCYGTPIYKQIWPQAAVHSSTSANRPPHASSQTNCIVKRHSVISVRTKNSLDTRQTSNPIMRTLKHVSRAICSMFDSQANGIIPIILSIHSLTGPLIIDDDHPQHSHCSCMLLVCCARQHIPTI